MPNDESGEVNLLGWNHNPQPRNLRVSDDRQQTPSSSGTPPPYRPPPQREPPPTNQRLICHDCYERGHISRQCNTPINKFDEVIANYESLNEEERKRVPILGYKRAKAAASATLDDVTAVVEVDEADKDKNPVEGDEYKQAHLN